MIRARLLEVDTRRAGRTSGAGGFPCRFPRRAPRANAPPLAVACGPTPAEEPRAPDHVLMILVDTLRADFVGSYGHPRAPTPAIDMLAARGVRFEEAYSQSSWTGASMVSLFTGRYLADDRLELPAELPTLALSFQTAGWATGAFIMNDIVNAEHGFDRGFDHFEQLVPYAWKTSVIDEWLGTHADGKAFTYVHLNEAHDPYQPPDEHLRWRVDPDPVSAKRRHFYETVQRELNLEGELADEVLHIEAEIGGYVDDVHYTDRRIGELFAALDRRGLTERTCVVVTADHGEGLWTRVAMMSGKRRQALEAGQAPRLSNTLMWTHGNQVNRELVHVPWVMAGPNLPAGTVVEGPVELVDLFPTLLEVCDLPVPHGLQGTSRLPAVRGRAQEPAQAFALTRMAATLITPDGWQLVQPTDVGVCEEGLLPELYYLPDDPEARNNRAVEEPEVLRELQARLAERRRVGIEQAETATRLSAATREVLGQLGYVDRLEEVPDELFDLELGVLLRVATSADYTPCIERLAAARALAARRGELDPEGLTAVRARLANETSVAVRSALEAALSPE